MSEQAVHSGVGRAGTADYLGLVAYLLYAAAGLAFLVGLYFDWQHTGQVFISQFALADEPNANSGLFILSILLLIVGYALSLTSGKIREWNTEKVDQTQEWTVDVGEAADE
jgi:hypothetical protein